MRKMNRLNSFKSFVNQTYSQGFILKKEVFFFKCIEKMILKV